MRGRDRRCLCPRSGGPPMVRPQREPLRPLPPHEAATLQHLVKATSERHDRRQRASALLAVAAGAPFGDAARQAGYREADSVSQLVARFNQHGLAALDIARGRGHPPTYGPAERARILAMLQRPPQRRAGGTATWSLGLLGRALRQEGAGFGAARRNPHPPPRPAAGVTPPSDPPPVPNGTGPAAPR